MPNERCDGTTLTRTVNKELHFLHAKNCLVVLDTQTVTPVMNGQGSSYGRMEDISYRYKMPWYHAKTKALPSVSLTFLLKLS